MFSWLNSFFKNSYKKERKIFDIPFFQKSTTINFVGGAWGLLHKNKIVWDLNTKDQWVTFHRSKLKPYSLISIRKNYNFDILATIWLEIVSWYLEISQDLWWFAQHDHQIVFVLIFISVQNIFMITTSKNWGKLGKMHKSTSNAMSNYGSNIEINDWSHAD